jgi:hypothetical protein
MAIHKYKIGHRVIYRPSRSNFPIQYVVTALLPARASDCEFKYRIQRQHASENLLASESELRAAKDH